MIVSLAVFTILAFTAGCICARGLHVLFQRSWISISAVLLTVTVPLSVNLRMDNIVRVIGHLYVGFILYFSMCCMVIYATYLFKPSLNYRQLLKYSSIAVIALLVVGYINAINPTLKEISINADTNAKICFVSDIHVGSINSKTIMARVVTLINQSNPDIVIIGGDTIDLNALTKYRNDFIQTFSQITQKFRTIAVIGNHEIYTGLCESIKLLEDAGIEVLLDRAVSFKNFTIIGRLDCSIAKRKKIPDLISNTGKNTIVIDHQPNDISNIVENNVFLHLAGHTHSGQMIPMNFIVNFVYPTTGILHKFKNSYVYISPGAGFWGPPFRIGNHPEVVLIHLKTEHKCK